MNPYRISARTHAATVTKAAGRLGVALPATYLEQVAQVEAFADAVAQIGATTEQIDAAVFDAIEAGRDYQTDKTVQRLALDRQLLASNIRDRARSREVELLAAALADHADAILESWSAALEPHAAALVAAAEAGLDLDDDRAAITKGGSAMQLLHDAQNAAVIWTEALRGFYALANASGVRVAGGYPVPLALTPARRADLAPAVELARDARAEPNALARDARTEPDAWDLARAGLPLRLATIAEFSARAATFNADAAAAEHAAEQARLERVVNSW
jgi:hypothetical protein